MNDNTKKLAEETCAFARYLSWADLLNTLFEEELVKEPPIDDVAASRKHKWRWFGLMCYWYASLQAVIEAWDHLQFTDPVIDRLLAHPRDYRTLFRRYRNGVVHFQDSLLDSRFIDLLKQGTECVSWVRALHNELVRFFSEHIARLAVTQDQLSDLRDGIERIVYWYPYHEDPDIESLELTLVDAREALRRHPDDASSQRDELEQALKSGEAALQEGRRNWAKLRAHTLREAGIE